MSADRRVSDEATTRPPGRLGSRPVPPDSPAPAPPPVADMADLQQIVRAPTRTLRPVDVLALQQTVGNRVVQRWLDTRTHDQSPDGGHSGAGGSPGSGGGVAPGADAAVAAAARSSGQPLPPTLQTAFESALGMPMDGVRVHTGPASVEAAESVGARAFTVGQDIHLGSGHYAPESGAGQRLLAHEAAHTVQQRGAAAGMAAQGLAVSTPGDPQEVEAERFAQAFVAGDPAAVTPGAAGAAARAIIQRDDPSGGGSGGTSGNGGSGGGGNQEYVPEMSVKPDAAEIRLGEVHTERLDILNTGQAPRGTTFQWGGGIQDASSNVLAFQELTPANGPHAQLKVKGRAPGATTIDANIEHQVPGGAPVVTPGPTPTITVKTPVISIKATSREALGGPEAGNPEDPTRLSVGDKLVVIWTFSNVQGLSYMGSVVQTSGPGLDSVLAPEPATWTAPDTYQRKFLATGVGAANLQVKFQFGDMTVDQAITDTVEGHVEMSRQEFLNATVQSTAMIVTADQKATAWMDSLAVAYSDAWHNHTQALKDQADFERLVGELILGAALAFVPGGIGGVIGKAMGNATLPAAFLSDGVKDLAKWGMRRVGSEIRPTGTGLTAYPTDPFQWNALKGVRMHNEMGMAAQMNESWIAKARASDVDFLLDFDPAKVMEDALKIDGNDLRSLAPVDMDAQSKLFEKGFWSKWLETYGYTLSRTTDRLIGRPIEYSAVQNAGKKVKERCETLGLDITPYLEASRQRVQEEADRANAAVDAGTGV